MAFRPVEQSAAHAYRLRQNGTSASSFVLSGTAFFQYYGIPLVSEARRLEAEVKDGLLTVDLKQEGVALPTRSAKSKRAKPTDLQG